MNIYPTIIKCKRLSDGKHKIRIAVSHNSKTRYIPTRYVIDDESNINSRGDVVNMPNASIVNREIRSMIQNAYSICDKIENIEVLDCSQVVDILSNKGMKKNTSLDDIFSLWAKSKMTSVSVGSMEIITDAIDSFKQYKGGSFILSSLTPDIINDYHLHLKNVKKYTNTTIRIKLANLKSMVRFAERRRIVSFDIDPFIDMKIPKSASRDIKLSIDELRSFIAYEDCKKCTMETKNMFLLSFYMCGMNLGDLENVDFNKDVVRFKRRKTASRTDECQYTEFHINEKAKMYFNKLLSKKGKLIKVYRRKNWRLYFNAITSELNFEKKIMMYSARKTFAQLMAEIGYNDSIIEYCIGDVQSSKVISFYRSVNMEMADEAIQDIIDFVDSGMSAKEYRNRKR